MTGSGFLGSVAFAPVVSFTYRVAGDAGNAMGNIDLGCRSSKGLMDYTVSDELMIPRLRETQAALPIMQYTREFPRHLIKMSINVGTMFH